MSKKDETVLTLQPQAERIAKLEAMIESERGAAEQSAQDDYVSLEAMLDMPEAVKGRFMVFGGLYPVIEDMKAIMRRVAILQDGQSRTPEQVLDGYVGVVADLLVVEDATATSGWRKATEQEIAKNFTVVGMKRLISQFLGMEQTPSGNA